MGRRCALARCKEGGGQGPTSLSEGVRDSVKHQALLVRRRWSMTPGSSWLSLALIVLPPPTPARTRRKLSWLLPRHSADERQRLLESCLGQRLLPGSGMAAV
jgi:hypothetical protein